MKSNSKLFVGSTIFALAAMIPVHGNAQSLEDQLLGANDVPSILHDLIDDDAVAMTNFDKAMAQGQSIKGIDVPTWSSNREVQTLRRDDQAYQQYLRLLNQIARQ